MNKLFFPKWIIPAFLFFSCSAAAQDTLLGRIPSQWTLENCIEYAKKNNIQVRTLQWNIAAGRENLEQARAARLPSVSGSVSQNVLNGKIANTNGGFDNRTTLSGNYSINSDLTLYNGGYLRTDIRAKDLLLQSAALDVKEAENNVTLSVTQAYLSILLARENIIYLQDVLATSQVQLKLGQQRYDTGALSRKDLVQLEAQVAADQYNLVTSQNNYRLNVVTLKQSLQLPSSYELKIVVPDTVVVEQVAPSLAAAQNTAQQIRPEVKNDEVSVQIAQTNMEKAQAQVKPTINLGGSLSSGTSTSQDPKYFSQLGNNFYQSLGVSLNIPIFSRRVNRTAVTISKIQIEQAKLALANTKTILDQQVEQAVINLENADAQFDAASAQLKASEESYRITNEQFRLGSVNLLDLQQQRTLYVQALQSYIQSKYNAVLNYKIVDYYTGKPISL